MERIKNLNLLQKISIIASLALIVVFAVLYILSYNRVGISYKDSFLIKSAENGDTVYSGKIDGKEAVFTVRSDSSVYYRYGNDVFGPYTVVSDPSAVYYPTSVSASGQRPGAEGISVYQGDDLLFRGGLYNMGSAGYMLCDTNGELLLSGIVTDKRPNPYSSGSTYDPVMPGVMDIIYLVKDPTLARRCFPTFYILGVLVCIYNILAILFEDELFRLRLSFSVYNPATAEPSDWELLKRKIGYIATPILTLVVFVAGLCVVV